jgi:serine/threonine protein kinase/tetratricopeptide (TPR) repeat protein
MIGNVLGRYRILEPLGEGGMGRVFLAEDPSLGRRVAIKVLPPEFATDAERRERLVSEARAASALNHPNIVTMHDLGEHDGSLYVAMEYVDGPTLRAWSGQGRRSPAEVVAMVRQATRGLAVAHAAGLVHRDLKPENLMVRGDGILKVLDFGLVRSATPREESATMARTLPGTILGTAPYMSPEQVLGKAAGPASDVFSLGTILHELLVGRHPFDAGNAVETMHRILHETPRAPSQAVPGLPGALDFVLAKALAKDPARRYANARELDLDLETCEGALAAPASGIVPPASATATGTATHTIAVLPFKNIGGSPELNYLGIGLADAVITRLSSSPDLVVRATSSIARYENQPVDPRQVARELEVSAVLDASFQRAGNRFRATARLVGAGDGTALWAGKIDLDFDDIFAVQDDVANGIAQALAARLTQPRAAYVPSPEVFEMVLRAQEPFRTGQKRGLVRSIELLEEAVAREPGYADAWGNLAQAYHSIVDSGFTPDPEYFAKAEAASRRALELDPAHPSALFTLGALELVRGRKREAYAALMAQHRLRPNDGSLLHYLAYLFRLANLVDESLDADARSHRADPIAPWADWMSARTAIEAGRTDYARRLLDRSGMRHAGQVTTRSLGLILLRTEGRFDEVIAAAEKLGSDHGDTPRASIEYAYALIRRGRPDEARVQMDLLARHAAVDMDFAAYQAALEGWMGNADAAFAHLARAVELGNDSLYLYEREDLFEPLWADPRWEPFLAGVRARCAEYAREFRWTIDPAVAI